MGWDEEWIRNTKLGPIPDFDLLSRSTIVLKLQRANADSTERRAPRYFMQLHILKKNPLLKSMFL